MIGQQPRFALEELTFPFPALAAAAGRAALGGAREVTMACLMAARLGAALMKPFAIPVEGHHARADNARHWIGTLTLPSDVRSAALRVIEAAGRMDVAATGSATGELASVSAQNLDEASRTELKQLAQRLARAENVLQQS